MMCIVMRGKTFFIGVVILAVLAVAYVIPISYSEQYGDVIAEVQTTLLGEMIFYNPYVLGLYVAVAVVLMVRGWKGKTLRAKIARDIQ